MAPERLRFAVRLCLAACLALGLAASKNSHANEFFSFGQKDSSALVTGGIGSIGNIWSDRDSAAVFSIEYRTSKSFEFLRLRPVIGILATTDESVYAWIGLSTDMTFFERIVVSLDAGVGGYDKGNGQTLGHDVNFRTGGRVAWRFDNNARLGVGFHHLSNGGLDMINPGTESLSLYYSHPLSF